MEKAPMKARNLIYRAVRWFYWHTAVPAEDPLLEKLLFDAFLRGRGSVDLHVQVPSNPSRPEHVA